MDWSGEMHFDNVWMAFRGDAGDNRMHAHAALQLGISDAGAATLVDGKGRTHVERAHLVPPGVSHRLESTRAITIVFVEPQSAFARTLLDDGPRHRIYSPPRRLLDCIDTRGALSETLAGLAPGERDAAAPLDPRLLRALDFLADAALKGAVSHAAAHCGLSESRLRAIAQAELGVPLSKWLVWKAMRRAFHAIARRNDLASAAISGGFADQSHFTRTVRKMIGITPSEARRLAN